MAKVGINGFGRIGHLLLRAMIERQPTKIIPCAINDPGLKSPKYAAYIFKHDSIHGKFYGKVCSDDKHLLVNEHKIAVYNEADSNKVGTCIKRMFNWFWKQELDYDSDKLSYGFIWVYDLKLQCPTFNNQIKVVV